MCMESNAASSFGGPLHSQFMNGLASTIFGKKQIAGTGTFLKKHQKAFSSHCCLVDNHRQCRGLKTVCPTVRFEQVCSGKSNTCCLLKTFLLCWLPSQRTFLERHWQAKLIGCTCWSCPCQELARVFAPLCSQPFRNAENCQNVCEQPGTDIVTFS